MTADARLAVGFASHTKTKRLYAALGAEGPLRFIYLLLWAAQHRTSGDLAGMSDQDIELAVDWPGKPGALVSALRSLRYLDGAKGTRRIHDWETHQPWLAGSDLRRAKARWNAIKGHHGEAEADRAVPEWAAVRNAQVTASSSAPSPPPLPKPSLRSIAPTRDKQLATTATCCSCPRRASRTVDGASYCDTHAAEAEAWAKAAQRGANA